MKYEIKPFAEDSDNNSDVESKTTTAVNGVEETSDEKNSDQEKAKDKNEVKCEAKEYESRHNLKGEAVLKEIGGKAATNADTSDEQLYSLRYYKYYSRHGTLEEVVLKIFSPHIQQALQTIVKSHPGQNMMGDPVILEGPAIYDTLGCFYHYRAELEEYAKSVENVAAKLDVQLALKLADKELRQYIERYKVHVENPEDARVAFSDIWMIFKPGELVFAGKKETERILQILHADFSPAYLGQCARWTVAVESFAYDGKSFGYISQSFRIDAFKGTKSISRLPVRPLKYHPDEASLRQKQIARAKKLCTLVGIQHRAYSGEATAIEHHIEPTFQGGTDKYTEETITLSGRVIIDHLAFTKHRTNKGIAFHNEMRIDADAVTEEDYVRSHYQVPGFALLEKRWGWFRIDQISDVDWDDEAFNFLMLPSGQKRIVRALTRQHTSQNDSFDDLIKGKGRGCVFLLHGAPGIGKTFTVESVADKIKRPLYVMMSDEFGSNIEVVERNLRRVLKLVTTWKAVLLIDEADVFLEKRSSQDLTRNGLVSIFLRTLEYFQGIMFLTTNRVGSFDLAFQSRIHLALKYHPLDADGRAELWRLFLKRTGEQDWPEEVVKKFAAVELNGRQIKNTVRTANALALSEGRVLSAEEIQVVLDTVTEFDVDFRERTYSADGFSPRRSLSLGTAGMGSLALDGQAH